MGVTANKNKRFNGFRQQTRSYMERYDDLLTRGVRFSTESNIVPVGKQKVALVVGHRRHKQGAVNINGTSEYEFWKRYLNEAVDYLPEEYEYRIFYRQDFTNSYSENMEELTGRINAFNPAIAISFHFNASDNPTVEGHEVLCSNSDLSKHYATAMNELFNVYIGNNDRGIKVKKKNQRGGGFLYRTNMPAILLEPYFGTSKSDTENFIEHLDEFTEAIGDFLLGNI